MTALDPRQRAWVEVSPRAIEANARAVCGHLKPTTTLMAVVKADGYGHGAETVARAALRGGAGSLGVATLAEGLELRRAGLEGEREGRREKGREGEKERGREGERESTSERENSTCAAHVFS